MVFAKFLADKCVVLRKATFDHIDLKAQSCFRYKCYIFFLTSNTHTSKLVATMLFGNLKEKFLILNFSFLYPFTINEQGQNNLNSVDKF
jgi:hypothetical protein